MPAYAAGPVAVELAVIPGLDDVTADEIRATVHHTVRVDHPRPGTIVLPEVDLAAVMALRTAGVAYLTQSFPVPRPRALLGSEQLQALTRLVRRVVEDGAHAFSALRMSAAGSDSPVVRRLAGELAAAVGLPVDPVDGDLVVRLYRADEGGWVVGIRLTPRPLSARGWRSARFPGALEATVAAAMVHLSRPSPADNFVELCCGSGTITVERLLTAGAVTVLALDVDRGALEQAQNNLVAAGVPHRAALVHADAADLPIPSASASSVCANPPWGHQMGSATSNRRLYPRLIGETARVTTTGGRFVLLSHEVRLTRQIISQKTEWVVERERTLTFRGHHPRIWTLRRR